MVDRRDSPPRGRLREPVRLRLAVAAVVVVTAVAGVTRWSIVGVDGEALRLALRIRLPQQARPPATMSPLPRPGAGSAELLRTLAGRPTHTMHHVA